ncbi:MAG TPA: rhomboid family intramembrane serine protease [Polyangiaceae bacterium]|nr:rhomboid family intramembrane serine protease [Polyangiaceae bacterium]
MRGDAGAQLMLEKPGPVLRVVLIGLFVIWLGFALSLNWGGASDEAFFLFTGNTDAILAGQLWRLVTAPLLHVPSGGIGHLLSALLGLYFLGASLETSFGSGRFARFLIGSAVLAYGTQVLVTWVLGPSPRLVPPHYFGAMPVVEAVAIAWACSFQGRTVNLFFVLPIGTRGLIAFVVGLNLLYLIAGALPPAGHIAMFAGMGYGYLLGGGTPSPLRRAYLRFRLARLEAEVRTEGVARRKRARESGLRVISGGKQDKHTDKHNDKDKGGGKHLLH